MSPKIAIIGAGMAGVSAANALIACGCTVTLFENPADTVAAAPPSDG